MAGFIYIMSNPAFPDRVKIGKSKKDPTTDRVSELNQTGVPEPFKVEYYAFVEDEDYLEQRVHSYFNTKRPNKNREFFSVGCAEAIDTIRRLSHTYSNIKYEEVFYLSPQEIELARREHEIKLEAEKQERQAIAERMKEEKIKADAEAAKKKEEEKSETAWFRKLLIILIALAIFDVNFVGILQDSVLFFTFLILGLLLLVELSSKGKW